MANATLTDEEVGEVLRYFCRDDLDKLAEVSTKARDVGVGNVLDLILPPELGDIVREEAARMAMAERRDADDGKIPDDRLPVCNIIEEAVTEWAARLPRRRRTARGR